MRQASVQRYLFLLVIFAGIWGTPAQAAVPDSQAQGDLQQLISQWHQDQPKDAMTTAALLQYTLNRQGHSANVVKPDQNKPAPRYQGVYKLPSGAWVMGFMPDTTGNISVLVDLNPASGGSEKTAGFNVKRFILNPQTGQVISTHPLGQ